MEEVYTLPTVMCPKCRRQMKPQQWVGFWSNVYSYLCPTCGVSLDVKLPTVEAEVAG